MRRDHSQYRGRDNEDASDGILVVQVRRLRAISREIFRPAAGAALIAQFMAFSSESLFRT
jgi:hypothetical protein